jgi:hypothetical protein
LTIQELARISAVHEKRLAEHAIWQTKFEAATLTLNENLSRLEGNMSRLEGIVESLAKQWQGYLNTRPKT